MLRYGYQFVQTSLFYSLMRWAGGIETNNVAAKADYYNKKGVLDEGSLHISIVLKCLMDGNTTNPGLAWICQSLDLFIND